MYSHFDTFLFRIDFICLQFYVWIMLWIK